MKIKLSRRDRGLGLVAGIILFALFLLFVGGLTYIVIQAAHGLGNKIGPVCPAATNDDFSSFSGSSSATLLGTNMMNVPTNIIVFELIEHSRDLTTWQSVTNIRLDINQSFNWTDLIDRSEPCGFFKITFYSITP